MRLMCDRCCGEMSLVDVAVYVAGYVGHGGRVEDVMPDWKRT